MGSEGWFDQYRRTRRYEKPFMVWQIFKVNINSKTTYIFKFRQEEESILKSVKLFTMKI
jgi:hypothetical protein